MVAVHLVLDGAGEAVHCERDEQQDLAEAKQSELMVGQRVVLGRRLLSHEQNNAYIYRRAKNERTNESNNCSLLAKRSTEQIHSHSLTENNHQDADIFEQMITLGRNEHSEDHHRHGLDRLADHLSRIGDMLERFVARQHGHKIGERTHWVHPALGAIVRVALVRDQYYK